MSRRNRFCSIAPMATFDAVFVGSGINSLAGAALLAREGWSVCVLERNDVAGGCIRTSTDLTLPGFTHEVLASWHPLFTGSAAYAELKDELDRRGVDVRQHGPADRHGVPRRLGRVHHGLARGERGRVRPARARRRCRLGAAVQRVHGERRPLVRDALDGALVGGRALARAQGVPAARAARAARVRREHARQLPRLGHDDVRSPRRRAASSRRGCCTRASARIRRRRAS